MLTWLFKPTIFKRIMSGFLLIIVVIIFLSAISYGQLQQFNRVAAQSEPTSELLRIFQTYSTTLSALDADTERYLVIGGQENIDIVNGDLAQLQTTMTTLSEFIDTNDVPLQINELQVAAEELNTLITAIMDETVDLTTRQRNIYVVDVFGTIEEAQLLLEQKTNTVLSRLESAVNEQSVILESAFQRQLILSLVSVAIAVIGSLIITRTLTKPIQAITKATEKFAQGNLEERVEIERGDEVGSLAKSFNAMAESIQNREEEIEFSEKRMRTMIDTLPGIGVTLLDTDYNIVLATGDEIDKMGFGRDMEGKRMVDAIPPEYVASTRAAIDSVFESGTIMQTESDVNGLIYDSRFVPLHNSHGDVQYVMTVNLNITERKHAEEQREKLIKDLQAARRIAEENSRLKSEFLSMMSHELRTPMNAIEGFTSIMLNKLGGTDFNTQSEDFLKRIQSNSKRLLALINDFLDLSRIESGRMELADMPFEPRKLVQEWRDAIGILADKKGIAFETSVAESLPKTLIGDAEAISKVAINLLGNAIKFTAEGTVSLDVTWNEDIWSIAVQDTGIGIPPHAREYIFDEFRQVDQSSKRKYGGTGLGLAISQKIVREMGGALVLDSEVGKGSTFTVSLPLEIATEGEMTHV